MKTKDGTNLLINIIGISIIAANILLKTFKPIPHKDIIVGALYILFFALWLFSIKRRVVQTAIRRCLMAVAYLELFWIFVRVIKFNFLEDATAERYCWYLYYLPMLMIPALCLILAIYLGKPETHRFRKSMLFVPGISAALFLLVITNDLHSKVFIIPPGREGLDVGNYSYGAGFAVIISYMAVCVAASFVTVLLKTRVLNRRSSRFLPLIPLIAAAAVCVINILGVTSFFGLFNIDITAIGCICITATLECCIQIKLILTNGSYDRLFKLSGIRALITDSDFEPIIASDTCGTLSETDIKSAVSTSVSMDNGVRLSAAPIKHGYVFWQDDLSELNNVLRELSDKNDYLQGKSAAVRQAYDFQKRERQIIEKNRLYNRILTNTKPHIELYASLVEQLAKETDPAREKALAVKIAFVSTFIKRRDNLIFLSESGRPIAAEELSLCIEESLSNLRLIDATCLCSNELDAPLGFDSISRMYECFYKVILDIIDNVSSICVYLIKSGGAAQVLMRIFCENDTDISGFADEYVTVEKENSEWTVKIS